MAKNSVKNAVNVCIGQKASEIRRLRRITLEKAGAGADISYQQMWKYENGENSIPLEVLYKLSRLYGIYSLDPFYEGLDKILLEQGDIGADEYAVACDAPLRVAILDAVAADTFALQKIMAACPEGVESFVIGDARQAQENVIDGDFKTDLILLDVNLPGGGTDLLKKLARICPVIMTDAMPDRERMKQCYASGASGYMPKGLKFDALKERVETIVRFYARCVGLPGRN